MKSRSMAWPVVLLTALLAALLGAPATAAGAHEHGVVKLDVAVDGQRLVIDMDSPLDNLLGFEHAPRNDAERARADALVKRLREAAALFRIDGGAGCTLAKVDLQSAPLQLGSKPAAAATGANVGAATAGAHGDLEASFEFTCTAAAQARFVELGLFSAFAQVQRIDVQVATPKGQMKATLRRPATRVMLVR